MGRWQHAAGKIEEVVSAPQTSRIKLGLPPRKLVTVLRSLQRLLAAPPNYYLALALGLYISLVGLLLLSSGFLPYVTDNNESFSMFIHARNMLNFGLGHARGLSDEANAIHLAGHPYVYTHEGNFPRLPVYLLLLLGVTKIEWQIVLLALVLGTSTIYLCFRFFSKISGPLFAFIVCATLTTDYLLFMQWEVNTFRVWLGLFFFLSLVCVQSVSGLNQRKAALLLFLTFVGLFYCEIVFATFAMAMCICYALLTYLGRRRLVLRVAVLGAAGATLALCGLLAQSVAYLGWAIAWRDIRLTLLNRNFYEQISGQARALDTVEFFLKHHIVYWFNNPDTRGYLSIPHFLYALGALILRIDTPYLFLLGWVLTMAWVFQVGLRAGAEIWRQSLLSLRSLLSVGALALLLIVYVMVSLALGILVIDLRDLLSLVVLVSAVIPGVVGIPGLSLLLGAPETVHRMLAPIWAGAIQDYFGDRVLQGGLFGSAALALVLILKGGWRYLPTRNDQSFKEVVRYLAAGSAAFVFVYLLFPGYLLTGYLESNTPLPVFIVDVWIALAFYMLIVVARTSGREAAAILVQFGKRLERKAVFSAVVTSSFVFAVSLFLLVLGLACWARIQGVYIKTLPPTSLLVLRELGQGEYRNSTFVSDNYSEPIAYFTENWAYMDKLVSQDKHRFKSGRITQIIDGEYLWEADRESNADYLHPQYYICFVTPSLDMAADLVALHGRGRLSNCSSQPLVRDAREGVGPFSNILMASDSSPRDMWAIVKLDPSIQFTRLH